MTHADAAAADPKDAQWGKTIAILIAAAVVAFLAWGVPAITSVKPADMATSCVEAVAAWADVSPDDVDWVDVSAENFSGTAWDFRGSYPGGTWACGGPGGEREPGQVVAYPTDGTPHVLE